VSHDASVVLWKEWRELWRAGPGYERGSPAFAVGVCLLGAWFGGVVLGAPFGTSWQGPTLASFLAALTAASVAVDAFAGERERHTLETLLASCLSDRGILLGKVAAAVSYAWGAAVLFLAAGLVTSRVVHGAQAAEVGLPVLVGLGFSLLVAVVVAAVGVLVSLRAGTVRQAQQRLMLSLTALGFLPYVALRFLSAEWKARVGAWATSLGWWGLLPVAGLLVAAAAVALALGVARFRRNRLTLW